MIGLPHPEDLVISALWRLHAGPWLATDGLNTMGVQGTVQDA